MLFRIAPAEKLGNEVLMRYDCLVTDVPPVAICSANQERGQSGACSNSLGATESMMRMPVMNKTQIECLRLFVEMGEGRTIPALHRHVAAFDLARSVIKATSALGRPSTDGRSRQARRLRSSRQKSKKRCSKTALRGCESKSPLRVQFRRNSARASRVRAGLPRLSGSGEDGTSYPW